MPITYDDSHGLSQTDGLEFLLRHGARLIAGGADFAAFIDGMQRLPRQLFDAFVGADAAQLPDSEVRRLMLVLSRSLWRHAPHPDYGFGHPPLRLPERNAPCPCGSLRKYKQCCAVMEQGTPLDRMNLLPFVLDALPRKRWPELVGSRVAVDAVADTAREWLESRDPADVVSLLAPWFKNERRIEARHEFMFDCLLDAYSAQDKPRRKDQLIEYALAHGDRTIRTAALQRHASILFDRGDHAQAWQWFQRAMRETPDSISLSHLEVTLLLAQGRHEEARARAQFWVTRVRRQGDAPEGLIALLESVASQGAAGMLSVETGRNPGLGRLLQLWQQAPPPASLYRLAPHEGSAGPLQPEPALKRALLAWNDAFAPLREIGLHWIDADEWLDLLAATPMLWNAFEVLSDLGSILSPISNPGIESEVILPLLDRGEALLRLVLSANHAEGLALEWGWLENRDALSLLIERIQRELEQTPTTQSVARLEWMVLTLNPRDNHGLRLQLMRNYLACGRIDDAIALGERHPDDFAGMRYSIALALFAAGRRPQADAALQDAVRMYPKLRQYLLAAEPKTPRRDRMGIVVGSNDEAWQYRQETLAVWQQLDALEWLHALRLKRRAVVAPRPARE